MIPIADLQIGNRVLYNGMEAIVYSIHGPYPSVDPIFNTKATVDLYLGGLITATEDEIEPIVLTVDILEKCRFEVIDDNPKKKPHYEGDVLFKIKNFEFSNSMVIGFECYELDVKIQYFHELQNSFKLLTRKELLP